jgi:dipeptidyl aminopeptidase/acylaminoacyl peptidase
VVALKELTHARSVPAVIATLLEVPTWRAFDVDGQGRVLAGSDESGTVQLVELAADGTATELTALPGACSGRYLPGERAVVVQHDHDGNERGQLSLLWLDEPLGRPAGLDDLEPMAHDPRYVHRLLDVLPGRVVYATNRRNSVDFDIVIRAVSTGAEEVVYDRGGMVQAVAVSPEARHVAITVPGRPALSDQLLLVDTMPATESGRIVELTDAELPARHLRPHWLAGGQTVLVSSDAGADHTSVCAIDVGVDPAEPGRTVLVKDSGHDLLGWPSPDGRMVLVETGEDGASRLALHDAQSGELLRRVTLPGDGIVSYPLPDPVWAPDSRRVALSYTDPHTPGDVLLLDVDSGRAGPLTDSAAALRGTVSPTAYRVPTPDGEQVPCLVYRPSTADTADTALAGSAVLVVHGGPEAQSRRGFHPVVQGLVAVGHTVVVPNVRGSTGYGKRWYSADDRRRRLDSVADLAAVHEWLPQIGCDPARAALWGGSYGGYMVLAGLAFQPGRWAAGVDIVGISSLVTFLENTADYRRAHREREYGSLTDDRDFLAQASPLSRVDEISAPLFVIHGANDPRVPLTEAQQLVEAVRRRGVECELLVYEDEGHGLARRASRLDAYPRALAFLARHLAR